MGVVGKLEELPEKFHENVTDFSNSPYYGVYWATALVLGVYALNFLMPGTATEHRNWNHLKTSLSQASNSALTLLPALSALVIPDSNPLMYAGVGLGAYFLGLGIQCIPNPSCRTSLGTTGCKNVEKGWYFAGQGLQTAGVSALVGSALIYMQNKVASTM